MDQGRLTEVAGKAQRHLGSYSLDPGDSPVTDPDFVQVTQGQVLRDSSDRRDLLLAQS